MKAAAFVAPVSRVGATGPAGLIAAIGDPSKPSRCWRMGYIRISPSPGELLKGLASLRCHPIPAMRIGRRCGDDLRHRALRCQAVRHQR